MASKTDSERMEMCSWCWGEGEIQDVRRPGVFVVCRMCGGSGTVPARDDGEPPHGDYVLPYWKWSSDILVEERAN